MNTRANLLIIGILTAFTGILMTGCEMPYSDDDDDTPIGGSSSIVGQIESFDASESTVALGLVKAVQVTVGATGQAAVTDENGNFTINNVPAGVHELYIALNGATCVYRIEVPENTIVTLSGISVTSGGQVIVKAIDLTSQDGSKINVLRDDDEEETAEAAAADPINVVTNLDQSQTSNDTASDLGNTAVVQTFTAGVSGDLVSVEVAIASGTCTSITVEILEGSTSLGSDTINVADMTWNPDYAVFAFNPQPTLTAGNEYSISITAAGSVAPRPRWRGNDGDVYAGGQLYIGGTPFAGYDMVFGTYMAVAQ